MRMIDAEELERLEDEVEDLRRAVRESAEVADRIASVTWPSPRFAATLVILLFAVGAFYIGRLAGMTMARATACSVLPEASASMTLRTPDRTITLTTDGEVAISNDDPTCTTVRRRHVDPVAVRALVNRSATSCFFEIHPTYAKPSDTLTNELTIRSGARVNTVRHPVHSSGELVGGCATRHELLAIEADAISLATRD